MPWKTLDRYADHADPRGSFSRFVQPSPAMQAQNRITAKKHSLAWTRRRADV
jgi:hypothetical protein